MTATISLPEAGPVVADGKYRVVWKRSRLSGPYPILESMEIYSYEITQRDSDPGRWDVGYSSSLGWVDVAGGFGSRAEAEGWVERVEKEEGPARFGAIIREWRGNILAEGRHTIPLSKADQAIIRDYLATVHRPWETPAPSPAAIGREAQATLDRSEALAMLELERTPLGSPATGRRCPECGCHESAGHRMDCCFA